MSDYVNETIENGGETAEDTTEATPKRISEVVIVPCEGLDDEEVMRRIESLDTEEQEKDGVIYLLLTFPGKATLEDKEDGQLLRLDIAGATDEETEYLIESLNMLTQQYPNLGVELNRLTESNIPLTPEQAQKLKEALGGMKSEQEDGGTQKE